MDVKLDAAESTFKKALNQFEGQVIRHTNQFTHSDSAKMTDLNNFLS